MKTQLSPSSKCIEMTKYATFLCRLCAITLVITLLACSFRLPAQDRMDKYFMGIELNDVLCGYSEIFVTPPQTGSPCLTLDQKTFISFGALGQDLTQNQVFTYRIDTADWNFIYHDSHTVQGEQEVGATMTVRDDSIYIQPGGQKTTAVYLPEHTLLPNNMLYPHLQADFASGRLDSASYRIFNVRTGRVEDFVYYRLGLERIELNDSVYEAVILQEKDPGTGLLTTYWIDRYSGLRLKMESRAGIRMYLTGSSVMEKLGTGRWDDLIFIRTNEKIGDLHRISSIMVQADLDAFPGPGLEDLNVPGQSFEGSISGNSLNGSFEVEHRFYKGEGALPFGETPGFSGDLNRYLEPEELIQSEDPEIQELASRLTEGSKDFWEAAKRLSQWVADSISGSIMGGSALETLHRGNGACGSQSLLLAALCRASGIPARVVWGCVYTPQYDGSFGHHGWNEVYMGEAGWIPVDATLHEPDYVDSGHIRLGELRTNTTVINFREMRILDYDTR